MSMRGVLRLGEAQVRVMDMVAAKQHYGERMGLQEMMTDDNGLVYYKAWDEHDHHSVVLREADRAGLDHMALKVFDDATLDMYADRMRAYGLEIECVPAGVYPKSGRRIKFISPMGHETHLYAEKEYVGNTLGSLNPGVVPDEGVIRGFRINGLDHIFVVGPNLDENVKFFVDVLDMDVTEKLISHETEENLLQFLSCSSRPHDVAFGVRDKAQFHHISFRVDSTQDHVHATDLIGKYRIPVEVIDRHGITRGKTIYFFDPSGNRNEVFSEGYTYYPDRPVLIWTTERLGEAAFSQSLHVPESFLTVAT